MIWLFLGALALVLVAMSVVASRTRRPIIPVDADASWARSGDFYRGRPERTSDVDLGRDWRSVVDPGAAFTLSWTAETRELVALRYPAEPILLAYGGGIVAPFATPWGTARKSGLKALARVDLDELRALPLEDFRASPDGLDRLTAAIGTPYFAPDPSDPRPSTAASRRERRRGADPGAAWPAEPS